jgi:ribonuclease HII
MKTDYVSASIIEDSDNDNVDLEEVVQKIKKTRQTQKPLQKFYKEDASIFEIGVDEAGRGPLFGRVYTGAVVLPKDDSFDHSRVKDSKKFHSKKKD